MTDHLPICSRFSAKTAVCLTALLIGVLSTCPAAAQSSRLLTEMLDRPVYDSSGEEVGDVEDIVFRRTGQVQSVLISLNGFLGLPDKLVAVQYRKMSAADKNNLKVGYSRDQLERRRAFAYNQPQLYSGMALRPAPAYGGHRRHARSSKSDRSRSSTADGNPPDDDVRQHGQGQAAADIPSESARPGRDWHDSFWLREYRPLKLMGSALLGRAVFNRQGRKVADVDDLLIQSMGKRARITKIVLKRHSGIPGSNGSRTAVPYQPVSVNFFGISYPIGPEKLENMPAFDPK